MNRPLGCDSAYPTQTGMLVCELEEGHDGRHKAKLSPSSPTRVSWPNRDRQNWRRKAAR
jgi:hypothetical protein